MNKTYSKSDKILDIESTDSDLHAYVLPPGIYEIVDFK